MKEDRSKEIALDEINMGYVSDDDYPKLSYEEYAMAWDGQEAILKCSTGWTRAEIREWLPAFDYDAVASVKDWLSSEAHIAEGMCIRVWI
jgi:hypothetical protein